MEIEIITTKKKLTKSIVNQMQIASHNPHTLMCCETLGSLHGVYKYAMKCALIKLDDEYLILPFGYARLYINLSNTQWGIRYRYGKFGFHYDFKSESDSNLWWKQYKRIKDECKQIYI